MRINYLPVRRTARAAALALWLLPLSLAALHAGPPAKAPKPKPTANLVATGGKLFAQACASCHGPTGGGGDGPNLQRIEIDKDGIEAMVRRGSPGQMPSFAKRFSQRDLDSLAAFVKSLHK